MTNIEKLKMYNELEYRLIDIARISLESEEYRHLSILHVSSPTILHVSSPTVVDTDNPDTFDLDVEWYNKHTNTAIDTKIHDIPLQALDIQYTPHTRGYEYLEKLREILKKQPVK